MRLMAIYIIKLKWFPTVNTKQSKSKVYIQQYKQKLVHLNHPPPSTPLSPTIFHESILMVRTEVHDLSVNPQTLGSGFNTALVDE